MKCNMDICDEAKDIVKLADDTLAEFPGLTQFNFVMKPLKCNEPHEFNIKRNEWENYTQNYKEMLVDTYYKFGDDDMINATK